MVASHYPDADRIPGLNLVLSIVLAVELRGISEIGQGIEAILDLDGHGIQPALGNTIPLERLTRERIANGGAEPGKVALTPGSQRHSGV